MLDGNARTRESPAAGGREVDSAAGSCLFSSHSEHRSLKCLSLNLNTLEPECTSGGFAVET